jgi:hypothetical protein
MEGAIMTSICLSAELAAPRLQQHDNNVIHVDPKDIAFGNLRPDRVQIEILVTNRGEECSKPTSALISAAPLGAFVAWQPLARVAVPGLPPGESTVLRAEGVRTPRQPLGTPDRVPPRRLLAALGADDGEPRSTDRRSAAIDALRTLLRVSPQQTLQTPIGSELPPDPLELLSRGNPHWAGNLNIFIGGRAVERHRAQALRVYPGRANMAMFVVGTGRDAYSFGLRGDAAHWHARLFDVSRARSCIFKTEASSVIDSDEWIELDRTGLMLLEVHPPENCSRGTLEVHVKQRSSGETAMVEFSLDPSAAGPGCYVV